MKIVLMNNVTGRYYHAPGQWVRRADNALVFETLSSAEQFSRANHIDDVHPVQRLAPYIMELLRQPCSSFWDAWGCDRAADLGSWLSTSFRRFSRN